MLPSPNIRYLKRIALFDIEAYGLMSRIARIDRLSAFRVHWPHVVAPNCDARPPNSIEMRSCGTNAYVLSLHRHTHTHIVDRDHNSCMRAPPVTVANQRPTL